MPDSVTYIVTTYVNNMVLYVCAVRNKTYIYKYYMYDHQHK